MIQSIILGTSTLATYLNDEYFESIDDDSKSLIELAKWNISALNFENNTYTFYNKERLNSNLSTNVWDGKIGIYYPSDYGFATGGANRLQCLNACMYRGALSFEYAYISVDGCLDNNWLYTGQETWFINRGTDETRVMFLLPQGYIDFGGQHTTPSVLLNVYP